MWAFWAAVASAWMRRRMAPGMLWATTVEGERMGESSWEMMARRESTSRDTLPVEVRIARSNVRTVSTSSPDIVYRTVRCRVEERGVPRKRTAASCGIGALWG